MRVLQGWSSNVIALMAERNFFLTKLMRSHGCLFEKAISQIFLLKNFFFACLIEDLYTFQLSIFPCSQYLLRLSVYSWFHHSLKCLVICFCLEYCVHVFPNTRASWQTVSQRFSLLEIDDALIFLRLSFKNLINFFSFLLSFLINQNVILMLTSFIPISMTRGIWSKSFCNSMQKEYYLNPRLLGYKNTRSRMELASCGLFIYLVGPGFESRESSSPRLSIMSKSSV